MRDPSYSPCFREQYRLITPPCSASLELYFEVGFLSAFRLSNAALVVSPPKYLLRQEQLREGKAHRQPLRARKHREAANRSADPFGTVSPSPDLLTQLQVHRRRPRALRQTRWRERAWRGTEGDRLGLNHSPYPRSSQAPSPVACAVLRPTRDTPP